MDKDNLEVKKLTNSQNLIINIEEDFLLRQFLENNSDCEEYFELIEKNRTGLVGKVLFTDYVHTLNDVKYFVHTMNSEDRSDYLFAIIYKNKIIGAIGIHNVNHDKNICSLGYWIDSDHRRKGFMTKAILGVINFIWNSVKLSKIFVEIKDDNIESKNLAVKLGFKHQFTKYYDNLKWDISYYLLEE
jgi:ribosomal-protein-serine acetyltransferase